MGSFTILGIILHIQNFYSEKRHWLHFTESKAKQTTSSINNNNVNNTINRHKTVKHLCR